MVGWEEDGFLVFGADAFLTLREEAEALMAAAVASVAVRTGCRKGGSWKLEPTKSACSPRRSITGKGVARVKS